MSTSLFPKPLIIERAASSSNGAAASSSTNTLAAPLSANLMPFTIGYDGPAPISRYMLLRPAPAATSDISGEAVAGSEQQPSAPSTSGLLESSFRGRVMHGTPISLPAGYEALLVTLPSESDELAALGGGAAAQDEAAENDRKRAKVQRQEAEPEADHSSLRRSPRKKAPPAPPKPAFMPSFSMDDDDDEEEDEDAQDAMEQEAPMVWDMASPEKQQDAEEARVPQETAEAVRIGKVVGSFGSSIMLWNPDGPIDEGDDPYVRTLREWMGVVGKAIHDE